MKSFIAKLFGLITPKEAEDLKEQIRSLKHELEELKTHIFIMPEQGVQFYINGKPVSGTVVLSKNSDVTLTCVKDGKVINEFILEDN
jgi:hypothetical protein